VTTRQRERDIVGATRALFDQRGMQDAPVDEIARAVGISRALVYRHFSSREELWVMAITHYLSELDGRLDQAAASATHPVERLRSITAAFADFCLEYPAFLDCALSLLRRPAAELRERVSDAVWVRLGQGMGACLGVCSAVLADGREAGVFSIDDPDFTANQLWTAALGTMHLARSGVGVRLSPPGVPDAFPIDDATVRDAVIRAAVAIATASDD
jgi:AcrR family transcriptional regulator